MFNIPAVRAAFSSSVSCSSRSSTFKWDSIGVRVNILGKEMKVCDKNKERAD